MGLYLGADQKIAFPGICGYHPLLYHNRGFILSSSPGAAVSREGLSASDLVDESGLVVYLDRQDFSPGGSVVPLALFDFRKDQERRDLPLSRSLRTSAPEAALHGDGLPGSKRYPIFPASVS